MAKITGKQIQLIHIGISKLKIEKEDYRGMLEDRYKVKSSTKLTEEEAREFIKELSDKGFTIESAYKRRYKSYEGRDEKYATPKQLRMIEAMWMSSKAVKQKTLIALNRFIKRITHVDQLQWILKADVQKMVKAIENIR